MKFQVTGLKQDINKRVKVAITAQDETRAREVAVKHGIAPEQIVAIEIQAEPNNQPTPQIATATDTPQPSPPSNEATHQNHQPPAIQPISKIFYVASWAVGMTLYFIGACTYGVKIYAAVQAQSRQQIMDAGFILAIASIPMFYAAVVFFVFIYKMWKAIQDNHARTTPGKAVGLLFVPFYNFYWFFTSLHGWAIDCNAFYQRHGIAARPIPTKLPLTIAVLTLVSIIPFVGILAGLINLALMTLFMALACDAINSIALASKSQTTEQSTETQAPLSVMAIVSLVLGVVGFISAGIAGLIGVTLGIIAHVRIKRSEGRLSGASLAIAGIVTSAASVVIGGGVTLGLLLPAFTAAQQAQRNTIVANKLKQIGISMIMHETTHRSLPPHAIYDSDGRPLLSWRVALLPYIEMGNLYNQFHLDEPWDSPHNAQWIDQMPAVYAPVMEGVAPPNTTFFQVFVNRWETTQATKGHAAFGPPAPGADPTARSSPYNFQDNTSSTFLVVEGAQPVIWTKPDDIPFNPSGPTPPLGGQFKGGFNAVFGDGHAKFFPANTDPQRIRASITVDGGENNPLE